MNRPGNLLIALCCSSLVACTTLVPVAPATLKDADDDVHVLLQDGSQLRGRLVRLDAERFELTPRAGPQRLLRVAEVAAVQRQEFSAAHTVLLTLGIVGIATVVAYARLYTALMAP